MRFALVTALLALTFVTAAAGTSRPMAVGGSKLPNLVRLTAVGAPSHVSRTRFVL